MKLLLPLLCGELSQINDTLAAGKEFYQQRASRWGLDCEHDTGCPRGLFCMTADYGFCCVTLAMTAHGLNHGNTNRLMNISCSKSCHQ